MKRVLLTVSAQKGWLLSQVFFFLSSTAPISEIRAFDGKINIPLSLLLFFRCCSKMLFRAQTSFPSRQIKECVV